VYNPTKRQVRKVLADAGAANNWAVFRAEAPIDATQQADAMESVNADIEVGAASNWAVFRSQVQADAKREQSSPTLDSQAEVPSTPANGIVVDPATKRQVTKVLADAGSTNSWAVFRAEAPIDATQQTDATDPVNADFEVAAGASNWAVFRSQVQADAKREQSFPTLDSQTEVPSTPAKDHVVDIATKRQVKKVLADAGSTNSWAVFRAEPSTDAVQQADAMEPVNADVEVAAGASNWTVFRANDHIDAKRSVEVHPTLDNRTEVTSTPANGTGMDMATKRQVKKVLADAGSTNSWAVFRAEAPTDSVQQAAAMEPLDVEVAAIYDAVKRADAIDSVNADVDVAAGSSNWDVFRSEAPIQAIQPSETSSPSTPRSSVLSAPVVDPETVQQVKKVLEDSGSANEWAVFRSEAPTDGVQRADAAVKLVTADVELAEEPIANWAVFRADAPPETTRDEEAAGVRIAFVWAKLAARVLAIPKHVRAAAEKSAMERRVKKVLADPGSTNEWAVFRSEPVRRNLDGSAPRLASSPMKPVVCLADAFEDAVAKLQNKFAPAPAPPGKQLVESPLRQQRALKPSRAESVESGGPRDRAQAKGLVVPTTGPPTTPRSSRPRAMPPLFKPGQVFEPIPPKGFVWSTVDLGGPTMSPRNPRRAESVETTSKRTTSVPAKGSVVPTTPRSVAPTTPRSVAAAPAGSLKRMAMRNSGYLQYPELQARRDRR
jgi:hypothetical protein